MIYNINPSTYKNSNFYKKIESKFNLDAWFPRVKYWAYYNFKVLIIFIICQSLRNNKFLLNKFVYF